MDIPGLTRDGLAMSLEDGLPVITDRTGAKWMPAAMLAVAGWRQDGTEFDETVSGDTGWQWEAGRTGDGLNITWTHRERALSVGCGLRLEDGMVRLRIPADAVMDHPGCRIRSVTVLPELGAAREGDEGYLVLPANLGFLCTYKNKQPVRKEFPLFQFLSTGTMPIWGVKKGESAMLAVIEGGKFDASLTLAAGEGEDCRYFVQPTFTLRETMDEMLPIEDITIDYLFLPPGAGYVDMARAYRQYVFDHRNVRPLRDRAADYPAVGYAAEAVEFRIRQAWKPVPSPIEHQTPENEPPVTVRCDFEKVGRIVDKFRERGIDKAEFCLVGWNVGGHDGRYPQIFPVEKALGGEEAFRKLIAKARDLGYQMVVHDNQVDAYTISEDWDEEYILKDKDQNLIHNNRTWGGGLQYHVCPQRYFERFTRRNLKAMRDLGLHGMHYTDVISIVGPRKCRDRNHPLTRRQSAQVEQKQMQMMKDMFGGVQSEGSLDYLAEVLDGALNASASLTEMAAEDFVDEVIPFWPLVYHGTILYNVSYDTVNATCKGADTVLRLIEYGGRPFYYLYSAFMNTDNPGWMGRIDLRYDDEESFDREMDKIAALYRDYRKLRRLQFEFMDNYEKPAPGVSRITYSDGTVILVNYNDEPWQDGGISVASHGYRMVEP